MEDVKIAILITEYYPGTPSDGDNPAQPIGRLTPFSRYPDREFEGDRY